DDWFILGKDRVILRIAESVRMFVVGLHLEEVNHIYNTDLQIRHCIPQDGNSSHGLQSRSITAARHNNIRLLAAVIACPLPDADTLGAVLDSLIHGQPLD